jgi:hypothetical protein
MVKRLFVLAICQVLGLELLDDEWVIARTRSPVFSNEYWRLSDRTSRSLTVGSNFLTMDIWYQNS